MSKPVLTELHTHSTHSDGTYGVNDLAKAVADAGAKWWALTDHDTAAGCAEAALAAQSYGVSFLPGVEISAWHKKSIHVLGLGIDPVPLKDFQDRRETDRRDRMQTMVTRLQALGVEVTMQDVVAQAGEGVLTRPHLARALVELGKVDSIQSAFDRYLAAGAPAYVETDWPSVEEAIEIIHRCGGVAILAHPGIYDADSCISGWIDHGLDGIEVGHPKHTQEQTRAYLRMADERMILKTASSDYHGPGLGSVDLGVTGIPQDWLNELIAKIRAK